VFSGFSNIIQNNLIAAIGDWLDMI